MNVNDYDCSAIYRSNRIGKGLSDANPKWTQKTGFEGPPANDPDQTSILNNTSS
jgi:hypothetical protein